jgi:hypothetical protein
MFLKYLVFLFMVVIATTLITKIIFTIYGAI